jgi:hypothetical protein
MRLFLIFLKLRFHFQLSHAGVSLSDFFCFFLLLIVFIHAVVSHLSHANFHLSHARVSVSDYFCSFLLVVFTSAVFIRAVVSHLSHARVSLSPL